MANSRRKNLLNQFNNQKGPVIDRTKGFFKVGNHIELIKESLIRLIFTRRGTRMGNLDYGTNVPDMPFEHSPRALYNKLNFEISEAVARYEPRVQFESLELLDIQDNYVRFNLIFTELLTNTRQELPVIAEFS